MQTEGFLLTVSQIAVALAGFSGLVVATRGASADGWHPRDIWSLSWMFGASLGVLFFALLPIVLLFFRLPEETVWRVANALIALFLVTFSLTMTIFSRRLRRAGHPPRVRYFPVGATLLLLLCGGLAGLGGLEIWPEARVGIFATGLMACLFVAAFALVVFLVLLARAARSGT